ncbi:MAG: FtsX-like permease family protein [Anaerolineae bacterium]
MIRFVILRVIREWQQMSVLLLSMCLVTGFLALGPLYIQAVSIADFDQRVENAPPTTLSVTVRNAIPFAEITPITIDDSFGTYIDEQRAYATTAGFNCGFLYDPDAPDGIGANSFRFECYRPYQYDDVTRYFTLVSGQFPTDSADDIVQAVITEASATEKDYAPGQRLIVGAEPRTAITVEIVGIVEPRLTSNHPFWLQQSMLEITDTYYTPTDVRGDLSFAVSASAFERLLAVTDEATYVRQFNILPATLNALDVPVIETAYQTLRDNLLQIHPEVTIGSPFDDFLSEYRRAINNIQAAITLSFVVLVLMLYTIVATASLILEQQGEEWSMMASRGASHLQLIGMQSLTVLILGAIAALSGPIIAYVMMVILALVGPFSGIIAISDLGELPLLSWGLSAIASGIIVLALIIPAWSFAGKSLQNLKTQTARAPQAPFWMRYFLDVMIFSLGFIFFLRLLSFTTDDNLFEVLLNPSTLVGLLSETSASTLFSDVFNLAGPILMLLGASMLWLRLFPLVVRVLGRLIANGDGLTVRLAFWNVERDPGHYAQLVLLLIGTLALGTASLALMQTRTVGGWSASLAEVGAEARISLRAIDYDPDTDWEQLPGVVDAVPAMRYPTDVNDGSAVVALNPDAINSEALAPLAEPFALLTGEDRFDFPGLALPQDIIAVQLDVYAEAPQDTGVIDTQVALVLEDALGMRQTITLTTPDSTAFGRFITYESDLVAFGTPPYRIVGLNLLSNHDRLTEFDHVVYLDHLRAVMTSGEVQVINSFEPDTYDQWQWNLSSRRQQVLNTTAFSNTTEPVAEGSHSLRVLYLIEEQGQPPSVRPAQMIYSHMILPPIPVVVSESFANAEGLASRFRRALVIGDTLTASLTLPASTSSAQIDLSYRVVGIVDDYPSFVERERLLFVDEDLLRYRLNSDSITNTFANLLYDTNTVWFALENREPSREFLEAIVAVSGYEHAQYAWQRYQDIQRDPLANAVTGLLFAGFWIALALSLIDFGFYMAMTIRRRALTFATLQAIGWHNRHIVRLLLVEQMIFITPVLIIGVLFGVLLAMLILPFLMLVGSLTLQIPIMSILSLLALLVVSFILMLRLTALALSRRSVNQVMRFGE